MTNNPAPKDLTATALQYALIVALVNLAGATVMYLLGPAYFTFSFTNYGLLALMFLITVAAAVWSANQLKAQKGGYITMKEQFKYMFLTFVIVEGVYTLFNVVLFKYIDPEFMRQMVKLNIEKAVKMMQDAGMDQETVRQKVAQMGAQFQDTFAIQKVLLNWAAYVLKDALVAVIIASIVKKNPPEQKPVIIEPNIQP